MLGHVSFVDFYLSPNGTIGLVTVTANQSATKGKCAMTVSYIKDMRQLLIIRPDTM
jgi:hypothetical protein